MTRLNLLTSQVVYRVLRSFFNHEIENYGKAIQRETDISQGQVGESIKTLLEADILKKGKRTKAQYYKINKEGLHNLFKETNNIERDFDFVKELIYIYTRNYCLKIEDSNIQEMLTEEFKRGLQTNITHQKIEDERAEDLFIEIRENDELTQYSEDFIQQAFSSLST